MKYFAGLSAGSKIISCQKFTTLDDMLTTVQNYKVYDCAFIVTFISTFFNFLKCIFSFKLTFAKKHTLLNFLSKVIKVNRLPSINKLLKI